MKKIIAIVLVMGLMSVGLLAVMPNASASFRDIRLTPGKYTESYIYVPGEEIEYTMRIWYEDVNETYDVVMEKGSPPYDHVSDLEDNVTIRAEGELTLTYTLPSLTADGDYRISVYGPAKINPWTDGDDDRYGSDYFSVQLYEFSIWTDRDAYIPEDRVTVYWNAYYIQNHSQVEDGVGILRVYRFSPEELITEHSFLMSSGSYQFDLVTADPTLNYWIEGWFNDTATTPRRHEYYYNSFDVGPLGGRIESDSNEYAPGGVVVVDAYAWVDEDDDENWDWWEEPEPDVSVAMTVWWNDTGTWQNTVHEASLTTDVNGHAAYIFQLEEGIPDDTEYEIRANITKGLDRVISKWSFTVKEEAVVAPPGMTMELEFDKDEYYTGDTVSLVAKVTTSGVSPPITYLYKVYDYGDWRLLIVETKTTNTFTYAIPNDYEGSLYFSVTADNGEGNETTEAKTFYIEYGSLNVDADREYDVGDTITIVYELTSTVMTDPSYFYKVYDDTGKTIEEGVTTDGSFTYTAPSDYDALSNHYRFEVHALQDGKEVASSDTAYKISGFILGLTFDKTSYGLGDTMIIHYTITPRGDEELPSIFHLSFEIIGFPEDEKVTRDAEGTVTYNIPAEASYGDYIFTMDDWSISAYSVGIITIEKAPNPLASPIGGIPAFSYILLALVIIALLLGLRGIPRVSRAVPFKPKAEEKIEEIEKEEEEAGVSQLSVPCKSCGTIIEITTSKRPIEIMCPSCGETQILK